MQFKHLTLAALASYAFAQEQDAPPPQNNTSQDLNSTLSGNPQLSNLTALIAASPELNDALSSANNITILAPSDEAFAAFSNSSLGEASTNDPELLAALLQYHVLNGSIQADQITNTSTFVHTLLINSTYANVTDGQVVEALTVGNETVFYSGLLQNATVQEADIEFSGGVIHIIDAVLTLPLSVLNTTLAADLTALRGAVNSSNLIDVVNDTPDLTIFAPSNEAFLEIGSAFESLSEENLANILAYHVVNGTVAYSTDLENGTTLTTYDGEELDITIDEEGNYFVNAARVITPNILVANGVVHIVDHVLNPENTEGPAETATGGAPAFTDSAASDLPFTSDQPSATTTVNPESEGPGAQATSSGESEGVAMPAITGAVGYGALLGAGAAVFLGA